jgi:hypothetical protein
VSAESAEGAEGLAKPARDELAVPVAYMDLYKLAVEMADRISARRTAANGFFLTAESALVALLGNDAFDGDAVSIAGSLLAVAWWLLLRSYRDLNRAKFDVIIGMEARLPVQIFGQEWEALKADPVPSWRNRYAELNWVERVVPIVFVVIFLFARVA